MKDSVSSNNGEVFGRPILCGYCFGPKKMKTMNMVMAEASKAKLRNTYPAEALHLGSTGTAGSTSTANNDTNMGDSDRKVMPSPDAIGLTRDVLTSHEQAGRILSRSTGQQQRTVSNNSSLHQYSASKQQDTDNVVFTLDHDGGSDLRNICRYFRSSCSDSGSTGTCTASLSASSHVTSWQGNATTTSSSQSASSSLTPLVRVSFVPLDPDIPLEEQHGGRMDIIIHKLTEDILCLSQLALGDECWKNLANCDASTLQEQAGSLSADQEAAVKRVYRLVQFQKDHPGCCLVDDPVSVQTLMSRSEIAERLEECLLGVASTSGMPVESPKYAAIMAPSGANPKSVKDISQQLAAVGLDFPMIIKPLTAAGTKASHAMAVLMDESAVDEITSRAPCLCQEYVNHDSLLYKVYVLGDFVSVHKRRSLPNLPTDTASTLSCCEFDSQRPYPRLTDLGFNQTTTTSEPSTTSQKRRRSFPDTSTTTATIGKVVVNKEEVMPVVNALKRAFGLELFGFDVLITSDGSKMLVVDVNYFPSYKEVPNFPSLLAKYLTDRAVQSRQRQQHELQQQPQQQPQQVTTPQQVQQQQQQVTTPR